MNMGKKCRSNYQGTVIEELLQRNRNAGKAHNSWHYERQQSTLMCSSQLCVVTPADRVLALILRGFSQQRSTHNYSACRNFINVSSWGW